jgi:hypothetical protein
VLSLSNLATQLDDATAELEKDEVLELSGEVEGQAVELAQANLRKALVKAFDCCHDLMTAADKVRQATDGDVE